MRPRRRRRRPRRRRRARRAADAHLRDPELLQEQQRTDRIDRGERLARVSKLDLEGSAAIARLQVAAHWWGALSDAFGDLRELEPDLLACQEASLRGLGERHPCADEQRLDA